MDIGFSAEEASSIKFYYGKGCEKCNHTGYKGRQGIYEVLKISDKLRAAIIDNAAATELQSIAADDGFRNIQEIGREMMRDGRLTFRRVSSQSCVPLIALIYARFYLEGH
ncbi:hypothetical protein [Polynucleobacter necessarius]|uniref:ATPase, T2SS/T4P/T4SS family n=1 Tax=Polynucleobacter necessarius TaxID=576610 RepID=UPI000E093DED|nr:hypothetical protein [Polynucleobacter necessarius]